MEMGTDESAVLPSALAAHTRRIIAEKSTPAAISIQEGVAGYRETAMRIASVEQVGLGHITSLSQDNRTSLADCRWEKEMRGT